MIKINVSTKNRNVHIFKGLFDLNDHEGIQHCTLAIFLEKKEIDFGWNLEHQKDTWEIICESDQDEKLINEFNNELNYKLTYV